jgi:hypothetical protein
MSLSDAWAEELGDVELSFLYPIVNRLIEGDDKIEPYEYLPSKGEQDTAWAVKYEFERRMALPEGECYVWHIGGSS